MSFPATLGSALKKEGGCGRCYDEDKHNLSKNKRQSGELTPRSPNFNGAATIPRSNAKEGYLYGQHHPKVRFDDSVLYKGSAAYTYMALRWLADHKE